MNLFDNLGIVVSQVLHFLLWRKIMKRVLSLVLVLALAATVVFVGCKKKDAPASNASEATASSATITKDNLKVGFVYIGSINDEGYTQAHDLGRIALQEKGYKVAYVENVGENSDCEAAIRNLIDQGCNVIYTTSFGFMDWTIKVAQDFPNVKFAHCSGYKTAPNVSTYFGKLYQPRYLSGIAAGLKTKTNKIGFVGAFGIPEVIRGINAFTLGVQSVNPNAVVEVVFTNTWYDPALEKQGARSLLDKGCDVIAQHQDTTAPQIAAQERGAFAIGFNLATPNAAPKAYLTAVLDNWPAFYLDDIDRVLAGTWTSREYWGGLETGSISLDALSNLNDPKAAGLIADAQKKILDGSLHPFTGPISDQKGTVRIPAGTTMAESDIWNMDWFVRGVNGTIN
jgi:basic membrane protein A